MNYWIFSIQFSFIRETSWVCVRKWSWLWGGLVVEDYGFMWSLQNKYTGRFLCLIYVCVCLMRWDCRYILQKGFGFYFLVWIGAFSNCEKLSMKTYFYFFLKFALIPICMCLCVGAGKKNTTGPVCICVCAYRLASLLYQQTCTHTLEGLLNLIFTLTSYCKHNEELNFLLSLSVSLSPSASLSLAGVQMRKS